MRQLLERTSNSDAERIAHCDRCGNDLYVGPSSVRLEVEQDWTWRFRYEGELTNAALAIAVKRLREIPCFQNTATREVLRWCKNRDTLEITEMRPLGEEWVSTLPNVGFRFTKG